MNRAKKPTFSDWLQQSLLLLGSLPWLWTGYTLLVGVILLIGHIAPGLGIFAAVTCLLTGVGLAKYTDMKKNLDVSVRLTWAISNSLPLAIIAAGGYVTFWFIFVVIANVLSGEYEKILQFFIHWEFTEDHFRDRSVREISSWIFAYANGVLILVMLILNTYVSWFSYPLMLFKDSKFTAAKEQSVYAVSRHQQALYKLLGFIFAEALLCLTVTPLLTPVLYSLFSVMMYVSYRSIFEKQPAQSTE